MAFLHCSKNNLACPNFNGNGPTAMKRICEICKKAYEIEELEAPSPRALAESKALDSICFECYEHQERDAAAKSKEVNEMTIPFFYPKYRAALIEVARNQTIISEKELAEILGVTVPDIQEAIPYCVKYDAERNLPLLASLVAEFGPNLPSGIRTKVCQAIKKSTALH